MSTTAEPLVRTDGIRRVGTTLHFDVASRGSSERKRVVFRQEHIDAVWRYVDEMADDVVPGTAYALVRHLPRFFRYRDQHSALPLPQALLSYAEALRGNRPEGRSALSPRWITGITRAVVAYYEHAMVMETGECDARTLTRLRAAARRARRGLEAEAAVVSRERAYAAQEHEQLVRAALAELRECEEYNGPCEGRLDPHPFLALSLLLALLHAVRSEEYNALVEGSLDEGRRRLHLTAPNKAPRTIPLSAAALRAFRQCRRWSAVADALAPGDRRSLRYVALAPKRAVIVSTTEVLQHRAMRRFARKYHERTDEQGQPMLHSAADPSVPLEINLRKLRNATIAVWATEESNIAVVRQMAGHLTEQTTARHYTHLHERDLARKVTQALRRDAQIVAMGLDNAIEDGTDAEEAAFAERGGRLDEGGCGKTRAPDPADRPCVERGGCLACNRLVLQVSKRFRLEATAEREEANARRYISRGMIRDAQNAAERAKLARAHLLRIDTYVANQRKSLA
jgi:hypothetical protein